MCTVFLSLRLKDVGATERIVQVVTCLGKLLILWSQAKRANAFIKERQSEMNELVADLQMMISKAGIRR